MSRFGQSETPGASAPQRFRHIIDSDQPGQVVYKQNDTLAGQILRQLRQCNILAGLTGAQTKVLNALIGMIDARKVSEDGNPIVQQSISTIQEAARLKRSATFAAMNALIDEHQLVRRVFTGGGREASAYELLLPVEVLGQSNSPPRRTAPVHAGGPHPSTPADRTRPPRRAPPVHAGGPHPSAAADSTVVEYLFALHCNSNAAVPEGEEARAGIARLLAPELDKGFSPELAARILIDPATTLERVRAAIDNAELKAANGSLRDRPSYIYSAITRGYKRLPSPEQKRLERLPEHRQEEILALELRRAADDAEAQRREREIDALLSSRTDGQLDELAGEILREFERATPPNEVYIRHLRNRLGQLRVAPSWRGELHRRLLHPKSPSASVGRGEAAPTLFDPPTPEGVRHG